MLHEPIEVVTVWMAIGPCSDPSAHRMTQNPGSPTGQEQGRDLHDIGP
ncbi:MAG: hypothetical protein WAL10_06180 [Acetobacteraceae bacterium]